MLPGLRAYRLWLGTVNPLLFRVRCWAYTFMASSAFAANCLYRRNAQIMTPVRPLPACNATPKPFAPMAPVLIDQTWGISLNLEVWLYQQWACLPDALHRRRSGKTSSHLSTLVWSALSKEEKRKINGRHCQTRQCHGNCVKRMFFGNWQNFSENENSILCLGAAVLNWYSLKMDDIQAAHTTWHFIL